MRALVILLAFTRLAVADNAKPSAKPLPYRQGIMVADGLALGLTAGGIGVLKAYEDCNCEEMGSGYLIMLGVSAYLFASPSIHHTRGHNDRAFASAALRIALPAAGILAALQPTAEGNGLLYVTTGALAAMAFDWLVLARE